MRPTLTESQAERAADAAVWRRLATDSAYLNAEDAQAQADREDEITRHVWADLAERYEIT